MMDWNDPSERAALIERVGPKEYERQQAAHSQASVIETVNGYQLRPVDTRFGRLIQVGLGTAWATLEEARKDALQRAPGSAGT